MKEKDKQQTLFNKGNWWDEEWQGMPEFVQENQKPFKSMNIHFETRKDMDEFAKLVEQKITIKTQAIWYPKAEIRHYTHLQYKKDES